MADESLASFYSELAQDSHHVHKVSNLKTEIIWLYEDPGLAGALTQKDYACTLRKIMTKVKSASDSIKARPKIRKMKIPGRAPGLRARASVAEAVALP